jgi:hypothetical protein
MFTSLKKVFGGNLQFTVETYGKLPFYKDYIAIVTSKSAMQWKAFLLDSFGQEGMKIPAGNWPFIYQNSPKSELIVGLIEDSSDGIRQFPFSFFVVCASGKGNIPFCSETVCGIWQQLLHIRGALGQVNDIAGCYGVIRGKNIQVKVGDKNYTGDFVLDRDGDWPRLVVARSQNLHELFMIKDAYTSPHGFIGNWQSLAGAEVVAAPPVASVQPDNETTQEILIVKPSVPPANVQNVSPDTEKTMQLKNL